MTAGAPNTKALFQKHWRRCIWFWLSAVLFMVVEPLSLHVQSAGIRVAIFAPILLYFFVSFFYAHALYMRREIDFGGALLLVLFPWLAVSCTLVLAACVL